MCHKSGGYPSDMTDEQWAIIEPLLPKERWEHPIEIDMRSALNGMFYLARTGIEWDYLPHEYPNYDSVYYHYHRWCADGTWERINAALCEQTRQQAGRQSQPSAAIIDSQTHVLQFLPQQSDSGLYTYVCVPYGDNAGHVNLDNLSDKHGTTGYRIPQ